MAILTLRMLFFRRCEISPAKYSFRKTVMETINLYKEAAGMDDAGTLDLKYHLDSVK